MVFITVCFQDSTLLDFALYELKKNMTIKNVLIKEVKFDNSLPVNYPIMARITPDFSDYLDGKPHITDGVPLYSDISETKERKEVKLGFLTDDKNEQLAKGILRKFSGYRIKSSH